MSDVDRDKWDRRYREGSYTIRVHATRLLSEWLPRLPMGRALDVACGAGRNALYLAEAGFRVDAMDISQVALDRARKTAAFRGLDLEWLQADLDTDPLSAGPYDVILMVRYVNRPLIPRLLDRLRDGGYFVCEQHMRTDCDVVGPRSPEFRVQPKELLELVGDARVLHYHEGIVEDPGGRQAALAQLVACQGSRISTAAQPIGRPDTSGP